MHVTRFRLRMSLCAVMLAAYFGFILLIAFGKGLMGTALIPGVSVGIVLGAGVIVLAWVLTWIYVHHANRSED